MGRAVRGVARAGGPPRPPVHHLADRTRHHPRRPSAVHERDSLARAVARGRRPGAGRAPQLDVPPRTPAARGGGDHPGRRARARIRPRSQARGRDRVGGRRVSDARCSCGSPGSSAAATRGGQRDPQWLAFLREAREAATARREARANGDAHSVVAAARRKGSSATRCRATRSPIFDGNLVMEALEQLIPAYAPASRLTPGCSGFLGVGVPFAIAAKLVHPERPVVAICGDFAFGVSAMELETAVRHKVPIVVVVANNDGNCGSLRQRTHMSRRRRTRRPVRGRRALRAHHGHARRPRRTCAAAGGNRARHRARDRQRATRVRQRRRRSRRTVSRRLTSRAAANCAASRVDGHARDPNTCAEGP